MLPTSSSSTIESQNRQLLEQRNSAKATIREIREKLDVVTDMIYQAGEESELLLANKHLPKEADINLIKQKLNDFTQPVSREPEPRPQS